MPGNFDWMLDIMNFTLLGAGYLWILRNILKLCCGNILKLSYLQTAWFSKVLLLRFVVGPQQHYSRVICIIKARTFWVVYAMYYKLLVFPAWHMEAEIIPGPRRAPGTVPFDSLWQFFPWPQEFPHKHVLITVLLSCQRQSSEDSGILSPLHYFALWTVSPFSLHIFNSISSTRGVCQALPVFPPPASQPGNFLKPESEGIRGTHLICFLYQRDHSPCWLEVQCLENYCLI